MAKKIEGKRQSNEKAIALRLALDLDEIDKATKRLKSVMPENYDVILRVARHDACVDLAKKAIKSLAGLA